MVTIKDIAKEAGVSIATVSRVINLSPKASQISINAVNLAMKKWGYRPHAAARALVSKTCQTLGILVGDVSDPFFGTLVKSVDVVAKEHGLTLLIGHGYHDAHAERQALELLLNNRCEAIVVHAKALSDLELIHYAQEIPGMVFINRNIAEISERCIYLDNQHGAYLATQSLIQHGHRNIACIASTHDIDDTQARISGYLNALKAHNISLPKSYIQYGEPNSEGGELAMENLLKKSIPLTGIVAYNDYMAAGALSVLQQHCIKVPEKMSLIGFDDGLIARFTSPKLTTIHYPIDAMAQRAARSALTLARQHVLSQSILSQEAQPQEREKKDIIKNETVIFTPTLIFRHSVQVVDPLMSI